MNERGNHDSLPAAKPCNNPIPHERYGEGAPARLLIESWRAKREEDVHRKVATRSAATSRLKYRVERALEGRTVRPYFFHDHEPQQPTETRDQYERRLRRDRARAGRGVDADTVRSWTDLSSMSPNEKLLHKRKSATERQARRRKRQSKASVDHEISAIEEALNDFDIE